MAPSMAYLGPGGSLGAAAFMTEGLLSHTRERQPGEVERHHHSPGALGPQRGSTLGASQETGDTILNVNVKSPALLLSQLLPHMEKRGRGVVILVSSIAAYQPQWDAGAYTVSNTALLGLTRTLSMELAPKGIRVNCLVPGVIETHFSQMVSTGASVWSRPLLVFPCRIGQPEDCSGLVSFLCSPDASCITGENIVVSGCSTHL
ncbi:dehydrogenase/reductase SDR family member 2, mitochondrial [Pteronotus mesoamericanus]|uniref:dehydrogenase/reductase SDR family member 2, mitochondrial n=1 Tax=Pteronotus mesoamericanus TaxID=1884717 RepID=UPI0023EDB318|nr:dehydrogenase/reductase SDR family member 2, mitochondrial [Pteronotus parnellii mesoamericanus]